MLETLAPGQNIETEEQLFNVASHKRPVLLIEAVRQEALHPHSSIMIYHPNLPDMVKPDAWQKLSPVQRFIITRNPWMPAPHSLPERYEALEQLLGDSLSDQDKRQAQHFLDATASELNKNIQETDPKIQEAQDFWRREFDATLYPRLKISGPIMMVDHEATKDALKKAKISSETSLDGQVENEITIHDLIRERAQRRYIELQEASKFCPENWIQTTILSHMDHQAKLAQEIKGLNAESENIQGLTEIEQAQFEDKIKKTKSNFIFLISNVIVLNMVQRGDIKLGDPLNIKQAQQYREAIDQSLASFTDLELETVRESMRTETLFGQSSHSLIRQQEVAKSNAEKAKKELDKLKEEGWVSVRASVRSGDTTAIMESLSDAITAQEQQGLAEQIRNSGVIVKRNTIVSKFIPTDSIQDPLRKSFEAKNPGVIIVAPRDFLIENWNEDESFIDFVKRTYFSSDPSSNYFWEKLRPILETYYGINLADLANDGQKIIIDKYLDNYLLQSGEKDNLAEYELGNKVENELKTKLRSFVDELVFAAYKGDQLSELNPEAITAFMKAYLSVQSSFIEDPLNEVRFNRYLAEHLLGIAKLQIVFLKCGRWISPEGKLNVVPTIGDYQTSDKNGNPVLRSKHTERVNQRTLTETFTPLFDLADQDVEKTLVVADTDIKSALGFSDNDSITVNMAQYVQELTRIIDNSIRVRTLSDIFMANPALLALRSHHYQILSRIATQGGPTEKDHAIYFTGGSHFEKTIEATHLAHASIPDWHRSPSGMEKVTRPLNPYRYIVEKYADYISWIQSMQKTVEDKTESGTNTILVVGGRDPISATMSRASNDTVPIVKVSHYSDY